MDIYDYGSKMSTVQWWSCGTGWVQTWDLYDFTATWWCAKCLLAFVIRQSWLCFSFCQTKEEVFFIRLEQIHFLSCVKPNKAFWNGLSVYCQFWLISMYMIFHANYCVYKWWVGDELHTYQIASTIISSILIYLKISVKSFVNDLSIYFWK